MSEKQDNTSAMNGFEQPEREDAGQGPDDVAGPDINASGIIEEVSKEPEVKKMDQETKYALVVIMILVLCVAIILIPVFGLLYMVGVILATAGLLHTVINHYERGAFYRFPEKPMKEQKRPKKNGSKASAPATGKAAEKTAAKPAGTVKNTASEPDAQPAGSP